MSDVYHSVQNAEKSQIIYTNVAEIKLIPDTSEAKIADIKVKMRSQTLSASRQFRPKNSAAFRTLYSNLLNMFYLEFLMIITDDAILPMIGNLYHFLPSLKPKMSYERLSLVAEGGTRLLVTISTTTCHH